MLSLAFCMHIDCVNTSFSQEHTHGDETLKTLFLIEMSLLFSSLSKAAVSP